MHPPVWSMHFLLRTLTEVFRIALFAFPASVSLPQWMLHPVVTAERSLQGTLPVGPSSTSVSPPSLSLHSLARYMQIATELLRLDSSLFLPDKLIWGFKPCEILRKKSNKIWLTRFWFEFRWSRAHTIVQQNGCWCARIRPGTFFRIDSEPLMQRSEAIAAKVWSPWLKDSEPLMQESGTHWKTSSVFVLIFCTGWGGSRELWFLFCTSGRSAWLHAFVHVKIMTLNPWGGIGVLSACARSSWITAKKDKWIAVFEKCFGPQECRCIHMSAYLVQGTAFQHLPVFRLSMQWSLWAKIWL